MLTVLNRALLTLYQLLRMAMTTAVETRPGTNPDRASFTTALQTARDQLTDLGSPRRQPSGLPADCPTSPTATRPKGRTSRRAKGTCAGTTDGLIRERRRPSSGVDTV
jgi:hypothetical protein